jgi:hypothetical protein
MLHTCDGSKQVAWDAPRLPGLVAHVAEQGEGQPVLSLERLAKRRLFSKVGCISGSDQYTRNRGDTGETAKRRQSDYVGLFAFESYDMTKCMRSIPVRR